MVKSKINKIVGLFAMTIMAAIISLTFSACGDEKKQAEINFVSGFTLNKVYDGEVVAEPTQQDYIVSSDAGIISFSWQEKVLDHGQEKYISINGIPKNAGTYKILLSVGDNDKYFGNTTSKVFVISPKEVELQWTNTQLVYNGTEQTPSASVTNLIEGDVCSVTVSGAQKDYSVNAYTATASALSNKNYKLPENAIRSFNIVKKEINLAQQEIDVIYNSTNNFSFVATSENGIYGDDNVTISFDAVKATDNTQKYINAGTYEDCYANNPQISNENYTIIAGAINLVVGKMTLHMDGSNFQKLNDGNNIFSYTFYGPDGEQGEDNCEVTFGLRNNGYRINDSGVYTNVTVDSSIAINLNNTNYICDVEEELSNKTQLCAIVYDQNYNCNNVIDTSELTIGKTYYYKTLLSSGNVYLSDDCENIITDAKLYLQNEISQDSNNHWHIEGTSKYYFFAFKVLANGTFVLNNSFD